MTQINEALHGRDGVAIRSRDHVIAEACENLTKFLKTWDTVGHVSRWADNDTRDVWVPPHGWAWTRRSCGEPEIRCSSTVAHATLEGYRPVRLGDVMAAHEVSLLVPPAPFEKMPRSLLFRLWHLEKLRTMQKIGSPQRLSTEQALKEVVLQVQDLLLG